jgi:uncharacterized protein with LGFP repeats
MYLSTIITILVAACTISHGKQLASMIWITSPLYTDTAQDCRVVGENSRGEGLFSDDALAMTNTVFSGTADNQIGQMYMHSCMQDV